MSELTPGAALGEDVSSGDCSPDSLQPQTLNEPRKRARPGLAPGPF
jgi:hypothetical protein